MTATSPAFVYPISGPRAVHGGYNFIQQAIPPALYTSLQLLHLFGSDFGTVFPSSDTTSQKSTGDHSWNGRHLTKVGTTAVGAKSFTSSATDYFLSPLTGAQLMALSSDGSFTAYVVAKFITSTFSAAMSTWNATTTDGWVMGRLPISNKYDLQTTYANGALTDLVTPSIACDADTGVVYEFLAAVYDMTALTSTIYRMKPGGTMQIASNVLSGTFSPQQRICFGRSFPATNFEGPVELVLGGALSGALSAGAMADLQGITKTFVAANGVAI